MATTNEKTSRRTAKRATSSLGNRLKKKFLSLDIYSVAGAEEVGIISYFAETPNSNSGLIFDDDDEKKKVGACG